MTIRNFLHTFATDMERRSILIADSGSTKTDWALLVDGTVAMRHSTVGLNPIYINKVEMTSIIRSLLPFPVAVDEIHFFGAGCGSLQLCNVVRDALHDVFNTHSIEVASDMLGAARALFGDKAGIACILGTGSNSCLYDGKTIVKQVPSLGFILGDEGSGAYLGKRLVSDILKGMVDEQLQRDFLTWAGTSVSDIIERVYRQPQPNRFLASLQPFIEKHLDNEAIRHLLIDSFNDFFRRNVCHYDYKRHVASFIGSIAYIYADQLHEAAKSVGVTIGDIIKTPMEGLIQLYSRQG